MTSGTHIHTHTHTRSPAGPRRLLANKQCRRTGTHNTCTYTHTDTGNHTHAHTHIFTCRAQKVARQREMQVHKLQQLIVHEAREAAQLQEFESQVSRVSVCQCARVPHRVLPRPFFCQPAAFGSQLLLFCYLAVLIKMFTCLLITQEGRVHPLLK